MHVVYKSSAQVPRVHRCGRTAARLAGLALFAVCSGVALAQQVEEDVAEPVATLQERLTEREDENRAETPFSVQVAGRPLLLSAEFEIALDFLGGATAASSANERDRLLLENQFEAELFYSFGPQLSLFAQLRLVAGHDLYGGTRGGESSVFLERGEMWLYSEGISGSDWSFEIGRLDFEDGRLWWWDDDLDATRFTYETGKVELAYALALELAPRRFDSSHIDAEHDGVLRHILEASWDWAPEHSLEAFALVANDHSRREQDGDFIRSEREDDSDARLRWLGLRVSGAWVTRSRGLLGYWLDAGRVRGSERLIDYEDEANGISVAQGSRLIDVRGWAFDIGATWIHPGPAAPRLTIGYAGGSGDRDNDDGLDRAFRQSGFHGNEVGFGGVERFAHYGALLDPELSNLSVASVGLGVSLFESSSLDLVYNRYRLREPAESLRHSGLELELDGVHRDLGQAFDLVLAIEEGSSVELELLVSALRLGQAVQSRQGQWTWGGFIALRIAF